ncbi:MAG: Hsp70 family protein [Candidatus Kerfeldbacteria bacterium]|nr:Hsp70 family protein [Candidatus Kerfeldbacteria bacterium]
MVKSVVVGRPAEFSEVPEREQVATERLIAAVKEAGFTNIRLQLEPIAAEETLERDQVVLVADFGGGTTDFTIMTLSPERRNLLDRKSDVLANGGVYVGGDRFDSQIMDHKLFKHFGEGTTFSPTGKILPFPVHLLSKLRKWQLIPFLKDSHTRQIIRELLQTSSDVESICRLRTLIEENLGFALFRSIEKAKIGLSERDLEEIWFEESDISIREVITRAEFNIIIGEEVREFDKCVNRVMERAGITLSDIEAVFVTGGTSLVPRVHDFLSEKFGHNKIRAGDTFTSVVAGLAIS